MDDPRSSPAPGLGEFEAHADVGAVRHPGSAAYDAATGVYTLSGSGTNMWFASDEFQFVWKRMRGDFVLSAEAEFVGSGVDPHRKIGWMIRESLAPDSAYVDAALHGDGLMSLQYRRTTGDETLQSKSPVDAPGVLQLERRGGRIVMSVARRGDRFTTSEVTGIELPDEVFVGLFVCSHNPDVVERARFRNVRITVPAAPDFRPYADYIGSRLEIMDANSGLRRVVHTTPDSMQAPNWTPDGRSLIFNRNGILYRFDIETGTVAAVDTGFATRNNNDHVISFDGRRLGISHHSADHGGASIVYVLPLDGGTPIQVTPSGPSYLHGWSPDGSWLVYTGVRGDAIDIYKIRVDGGDELRLTDAPGVDDGAEFAPDGATVWFNSSRSGRMQIWRMRPDGSAQTQVTDDAHNNWFPHVAPDGERIVYLAYPPDIDPDDHPWYRPVYLMLMDADGGEAAVIANLYGGQGTINVPSWSPDGKSIAFVSNTVLEAAPD